MKIFKTLSLVFFSTLLAATALSATAQGVEPVTGPISFPGVTVGAGANVGTIIGFLVPYIRAVMFLVGTIAVIFLVYAGYKYITSQGNEEQAATAKRQIAYAIIGIIVALGSGLIAGSIYFLDNDPATAAGSIANDLISPYIRMAIFLIGTFAVIFLIYAGYKYITSQGNEEQAATAKRQIAYAILGIIVALGAYIILSAVTGLTVGDTLTPSGQIGGGELGATTIYNSLIFPFITMALFLVAAFASIFFIYAGYKYITSQGNEEQAATAKRQMAYAVIGIAIAIGAGFIRDAVIDQGTINLLGGDPGATIIEDNLLLPFIQMALFLGSAVAGAYLIYAGFKYIMSTGNEEEAATAKRQILYAIIGLIIFGIFEFIVSATINKDATNLLASLRIYINTTLTLVSVAAGAFLVWGGVLYITSQGDEEAMSRGKAQIIYAIIGLLVIALSAAIVNFFLGAV